MISDKQILEMAKLKYLEIDGAAGSWEKLTKEKQDDYVHEIRAIINNFGKLGLDVMPAEFVAPDLRKTIDPVSLEHLVREFIVKNVKKPAGIINLFPHQELVKVICDEFKIYPPGEVSQ